MWVLVDNGALPPVAVGVARAGLRPNKLLDPRCLCRDRESLPGGGLLLHLYQVVANLMHLAQRDLEVLMVHRPHLVGRLIAHGDVHRMLRGLAIDLRQWDGLVVELVW